MKSLDIFNKLARLKHQLFLKGAEQKIKSAELVLANKELLFQNQEKEKRAAELVIANKELSFQNLEKEKRAAELVIANKELAYQSIEKGKRAAELLIANNELAYQNCEKEKRAKELGLINTELIKSEVYQKEYIRDLEHMIHIISHDVRQPVCQIVGISKLLENPKNSIDEIKEMINMVKLTALSLDHLTKDFSKLLSKLKNKGEIVNNLRLFFQFISEFCPVSSVEIISHEPITISLASFIKN